jgi:hypothetical protein
MVIRGTDGLSSADLTSFLLYTMNLSFSLGGLSEIYSTLSSAVGSSMRMFALLDQDPKIGSRKPPRGARRASLGAAAARGGHLEFKDVHFSYPSRPDVQVLKGINLECKQGARAAVAAGLADDDEQARSTPWWGLPEEVCSAPLPAHLPARLPARLPACPRDTDSRKRRQVHDCAADAAHV